MTPVQALLRLEVSYSHPHNMEGEFRAEHRDSPSPSGVATFCTSKGIKPKVAAQAAGRRGGGVPHNLYEQKLHACVFLTQPTSCFSLFLTHL